MGNCRQLSGSWSPWHGELAVSSSQLLPPFSPPSKCSLHRGNSWGVATVPPTGVLSPSAFVAVGALALCLPSVFRFRFRVLSVQLVEEMGGITHIYSDKTGTLTKNVMQLQCIGLGTIHEFGLDAWCRAKSDAVTRDAEHRASLRQVGGKQREKLRGAL